MEEISRCAHVTDSGSRDGAVVTAPANAVEATPFKRCYFYVGNQCYDHWVPTRESCHNIGKYGTTDQLRACLALFGFGVTKKP